MIKVFLDADAGFDFIAQRQPFFKHASQVFELAQQGELALYASGLSFSHWFYHFRQKKSNAIALAKLIAVKPLIAVATTDERVVEQALASDFADFEDALQYFCALREGVDVFLTRNLSDYRSAKLKVLSPEAFLKSL